MSSYICAICGTDLLATKQRWVVLNRYLIGKGDKSRSIEARDGDKYHWFDSDGETASGVMLCWPGCTAMWVDGEHVEMDVVRKDRKK